VHAWPRTSPRRTQDALLQRSRASPADDRPPTRTARPTAARPSVILSWHGSWHVMSSTRWCPLSTVISATCADVPDEHEVRAGRILIMRRSPTARVAVLIRRYLDERVPHEVPVRDCSPNGSCGTPPTGGNRRPAALPRRVPQSGIGPGHPACWSLLAAATGLDEDAALAGLRRGVDVALIDNEADGFRFRHALVRDAVLASMLAPQVMRMRLAATTRAAVERAHPGRPPPQETRAVLAAWGAAGT
jgi:hypothetical protein